jgi:hypothetical protein
MSRSATARASTGWCWPRLPRAGKAARLPNAKLRFYRGGHGFLVERPEFLEDVIRFCRGEDVSPREVDDALHSE